MERHSTFCRLCGPQCGLMVEVDGDRIVRVLPDRENPMSRGYCCVKGRNYGEIHQGPGRLRQSLRRTPSGHEPVPVDEATAAIAERLVGIRDSYGPQSIGVFRATASYGATLTRPALGAWLRRVGSSKLFSSSTIDQSAKSIAAMRMGSFEAGLQDLSDSDVLMVIGANPLVSHNGGLEASFPICNPLANLRAAKRRGMKLILIDPRRNETAHHADLFLQVKPGEDAVLLAAFINLAFERGWWDVDFCHQHVEGVEALREAVAPATVNLAAERCGVPGDLIVEAAELFGRARRGPVYTGTGPDMSPRSNLAEHLVSALNAICGRYRRAGDRNPNPGVLRPWPRRAQVRPSSREWEGGFRSRIGGHGLINGELPAAILADEILEPGPDRLRALVVVGGNPAACIPDQQRMVQALGALDLLVTIDPYLTETARLADYVIAPALALERPDHTMNMEAVFPQPFAQYTQAVIPKPDGVVEEWEFFWALAECMGLHLTRDLIAAAPRDPRLGPSGTSEATPGPRESKPTSEELLERLAAGSRVALAEVRRHPHGAVFPDPTSQTIRPPDERAAAKLQVLPGDVAAELADAILRPSSGNRRPFLLTCRRSAELMNTVGREIAGLAKHSYNPAFVHPESLTAIGVAVGDEVLIESDQATVRAVIDADDEVRPGVISMTHCWGRLPGEEDDPRLVGTNPARLISASSPTESINRMPRMSAIPVDIIPVRRAALGV